MYSVVIVGLLVCPCPALLVLAITDCLFPFMGKSFYVIHFTYFIMACPFLDTEVVVLGLVTAC